MDLKKKKRLKKGKNSNLAWKWHICEEKCLLDKQFPQISFFHARFYPDIE